MFQNYFRTAFRSFLRNRLYSVLNVLGLAIGMAVALLIGLWVHDQVTYDCFFPGYEQTYQVRYNYNDNGVVRNTDEVCIPRCRYGTAGVGIACIDTIQGKGHFR